jgi:2'-5' RNA ligase
MDHSVISAVLLPNAADSTRLVDCSAKINSRANSLIQLDSTYLPHITIAQFIAPAEEAGNLWKEIEHLVGNVTEITAAGINFHADSHTDTLWMDIHFVKSLAVAELQQQICQTAFAQNFKPSNSTGDSFRPHCTLALFAGHAIPALQMDDLELFNRVYTELTLAVGVNGKHWTFIEIKFPQR